LPKTVARSFSSRRICFGGHQDVRDAVANGRPDKTSGESARLPPTMFYDRLERRRPRKSLSRSRARITPRTATARLMSGFYPPWRSDETLLSCACQI
jgi:hypothetical protein